MALSLGIQYGNLVQENEHAKEYQALSKIPELMVDTLNELNACYAMEIYEARFHRERDFQYAFALDVECVIQTFITNPIFIAQYFIQHYSIFQRSEWMTGALQILTEEIKAFKNIKNSIASEEAEKIIKNLQDILQIILLEKPQNNPASMGHSIFLKNVQFDSELELTENLSKDDVGKNVLGK